MSYCHSDYRFGFSEEFYGDNDRGWIEERLFETDMAIVEWRKLASQRNRGIQRRENL